MARRHFGIAAVALLGLLGVPRSGSASIIDFIWEMSGPQMIGKVFHCEYDVQYKRTECRIADYRVAGDAGPRTMRRVWLTLDTALYTSTGKDSEIQEYDAFKTFMLAFEPMLEVRSYSTPGGTFSLHHGLVGLSYDVLFGSGFDTFDKVGLKFRPIGITYKRFNAAYNVRVYPNGFTADEFGFGPRLPDLDRGRETLNGFSVGYLFKF